MLTGINGGLPPLLLSRPRRTLAIIFALYLLSTALPALASREDWLGWFPATMSSFLISTIWGSIAICTTCAWLAGSVRRSGLSEWTAASARGVQGVYRQPVLICALLGVIAYTFTFVTMIVVTLAQSPDQIIESAHLSLVLFIAWVSAVAWAAIGATLGRFLRSEVAIPLALILSYASYVIPAFYLFATPLLNAALAAGPPWLTLQPADGQLAAKLFLWCGIALFFTGAATSMGKILLAGSGASIAGLVAVVFLGSTLTPIPGAADRVCLGDEPRVCTDRAHAAVLPEFHSLASNALEILPESLRPRLLDPTAQPRPGVLPVAPIKDHTSPALIIDRDATIAALGEALFYRCPPDGGKGDLLAASLDAWWLIEHGISIHEEIAPSGARWLSIPELSEAPERGRALADLSPAARQAWFQENSRAIADCALENVVWP